MKDKKKTFAPNTNEHLIETLKKSIMYVMGDIDIGTNEIQNDLRDALCNIIGDDEYCKFIENNQV